MRGLAPILISSVLMLAGCDAPRAGARVEVEQPRVLLPAASGRPGAAYFLIRSGTGGGELVRISSPKVERIELHETQSAGGSARMEPLARVPFDDIGEIDFSPGGKHAMLFGIDPALKVGDRVPLTFTFERAPEVTVEADVLGPGGAHAH